MGRVDPARMPNCEMARVIVHWTGGAYTASAVDRGHYHILVQGDGTLAYGTHSISANAKPAREPRASHTRNCNTGSIGVAVCAMRGAVEKPFSAGPAPMTLQQWHAMAEVVADLCARYGIPVTPRTVIAHGEVEQNLGIPQLQKWDPLVQPWNPSTPRPQVMEHFRALVQQHVAAALAAPPPAAGRTAVTHAGATADGPFAPQTQDWPGDSAVLLVHGVGNARAGDNAAVEEAVKTAVGGTTAVYALFYDAFNDWFAEKTQFAMQVGRVVSLLKEEQQSDDRLASTIAEFAGDVIWPLFSLASRASVQTAYIAQLRQMILDGVRSTDRRIPVRDLRFSIVSHSLGCFHTYEVLHAVARDPNSKLRPGTDGLHFRSVVFMASPVQLIRTIGQRLGGLIPGELATTAPAGLMIPSETAFGITQKSMTRCVSVTGDLDPIGGHFLRNKADWAFMSIQEPEAVSVVDSQSLASVNEPDELFALLRTSLSQGSPPAIALNNPHSWLGYVQRHQGDLPTWFA